MNFTIFFLSNWAVIGKQASLVREELGRCNDFTDAERVFNRKGRRPQILVLAICRQPEADRIAQCFEQKYGECQLAEI